MKDTLAQIGGHVGFPAGLVATVSHDTTLQIVTIASTLLMAIPKVVDFFKSIGNLFKKK